MAKERVLARVLNGDDTQRYTVSKRDLASIKQDANKDVSETADRLRDVLVFRARSKRHSIDEDEQSM
jgi:hypothetical protein